MKQSLLIILSTFLISTALFSQIAFEKKTYDYGNVYNRTQPISIKFVNQGDDPIAILKTIKSARVEVSYSHGYIQYGQTGQINISYEPTNLGSFKEKIFIYTNIKIEPDTLYIVGKNLAEVACPTFKQNEKRDLYQRHITVVDVNTKEVIKNSELQIVYNFSSKIAIPLGKKGFTNKVLKPGQYSVNVTAQNYKPHKESFYLPKSQSLLVFELEPIIIESKYITNDTIKEEVKLDEVTDNSTEKQELNNTKIIIEENKQDTEIEDETESKEVVINEENTETEKNDTVLEPEITETTEIDSSDFSKDIYSSNNITFQ